MKFHLIMIGQHCVATLIRHGPFVVERNVIEVPQRRVVKGNFLNDRMLLEESASFQPEHPSLIIIPAGSRSYCFGHRILPLSRSDSLRCPSVSHCTRSPPVGSAVAAPTRKSS